MMSGRSIFKLILGNRQAINITRNYASKKKFEFPKVTLNDLPSPEGDWYTQYNAQQKIYNLHLALGIGLLLSTIAFGVATDMFEAHNDLPEPAEIECYQ